MKQLFILFALSVFVQNATAQTPIPQCTVLSINHFGGNGADVISPNPGTMTYPDSTFSLTINTGSDSGNINTNCTPSWFFQRYNAGGTVVLDETCAPVGTNFQYPAYFVFPQSNGDTILIGQSSDSSGNYGMERRDASGNVLWTKSYGSSGNEGFYSAVPAPDGSGFFINGGSNSSGGDVGLHYGDQFHYDIWIIKVDNDGNLIWSKVIGGIGNDGIGDMVPSEDGGLYLLGVSDSDDHDVTGNHGGYDLYTAKLDSSGNMVWHHCYGGSNNDGGPHIHAIKDHNGGFYVGAAAGSSDGDVQHRPAMAWDFWLLHIDSIGNLLWENTYGGSNFEFIYDMCRSTDGSIWMGGISGGGNGVNPVGGDVSHNYGGKDAWVVHVDTMGNMINSCTLGNDNDNYLYILYPLPNGNVLAGGVYLSANTDADPTSIGFPKRTYGNPLFDSDIFLARLSPQTDLGIVSRQTEVSSWDLFPNPANRDVSVNIKNDHRKFNITVTGAQGKLIYKDRFKSKITIPTSSWAAGIYWVTVSRYGLSDTKKLIIQK